MKLKAFIVSVVSLVIVAIVSIALYVNWNAIKGTIDESKYYTSEDLQNSYDNGYSDGSKSETELTAQVAYFKGIVDEYYLTIVDLQKKNENLQLSNNHLSSTVSELENLKTENEQNIENLQITISDNEELISSYKSQIASLNYQISILQNSNVNAQSEIDSLKKQVANYQSMVAQLQNTNDMNIQTINSLNNQITTLNKQISELQFELNNNSGNVSELQKTIEELEKSIEYYESYIAELESETQVVATFEFDGSVYNIQIINKGSNVSVVEPVSTGKIIFNGWKVNDEIVNLSTYKVNTNTKFIADLTYKNEVVYMSNGEVVKEEFIENGKISTAPTLSREGYDFDGWTADGINLVDVSSYNVTKDITFTAVWTQIHTITFLYEDEIISTQNIRNGEYANNVSVESTSYKQFNGWNINGAVVDVSSYKISSSIVFTANITYSYDVIFMVDEEIFNSQIVVANNFVLVPTNPQKDMYKFNGWSINGEIVDLTTHRINSNTTFVALFTYTPSGLVDDDGVMLMSWDEIIDGGYLTQTGSVLSAGTNTTELSGNLYIDPSVTSIADVDKMSYGVFANCKKLTSVTFPDTMTTIGHFAFYNCTGLKEIDFGNGVTTFGKGIFYGCSGLREVFIPASVTKMNTSYSNHAPFYSCYQYLVVFFEHVRALSAFGSYYDSSSYSNFNSGDIRMRFNVKPGSIYTNNDIVYYLDNDNVKHLSHCKNFSITYADIEEDAESIQDYAFYNCTKLLDVNMPDLSGEIKKGAFENCSNLSFDFYYNGTRLDWYVFKGTKLTSVTLGKNVTYVGPGAFEGVTTLTRAYLDTSGSFQNDAFADCINLVDLYLGDGVTALAPRAFDGCTSLKSVYIYSSVVTFGSNIAASYKNSPFCNCSADMVIYCEVEEKPTSWDSYYNHYATDGAKLETKFGYTYEEYLAEIGVTV